MAVAAIGPSAAGDTITVHVDQASIMQLPPKVSTLIIGNPMVADVTLLKNPGAVVITGKGFGETNFIALDSSGKPVAESIIRVKGAKNMIVVQRGLDRESYSCNPDCLPAAQLGDGKFLADVSSQIQTRNGLIQPTNGQRPAGL